MKERVLTCIICPRGCQMTVALDEDGAVFDVVGNTCARGKDYAIKECTHPERVVTTTVRTKDGSVVPCKTERSVPKEKIFAVMDVINHTLAEDVLHIGDVVVENVAGTGVNVVATANKE